MTENNTNTILQEMAEVHLSKSKEEVFDAIMLDLETMSVKVTAAMIQIGACTFSTKTGAIGSEIQIDVDLHSAILAGGDVDEKTIKWWRDRGGLRLEVPRNIVIALDMFRKWFAGKEDLLIWAQGSHFDAAVLASAYERRGEWAPWKHYLVRDTRTIFDLAREKGWTKPAGEVAHKALDDCKAQVKALVSALEVINGSASD